MPRYDAITQQLEQICADNLGDDITYSDVNGNLLATSGMVDYTTEEASGSGSRSSAAAYELEMLRSAVPNPSETDVVTIAAIPGVSFRPFNISLGSTGVTNKMRLRRLS